MTLRSARERALQTCAFEIGGWCVAVPLYALFFEETAARSLVLMVALTGVLLIWAPLHNTLFDALEWRRSGRVASDRPHALRLVHALSLEVSSILVTLPTVMVIGGHGFREALAVEFGLTVLYVAYGYLFHLAFDRLRPVAPRPEGAAGS